MADLKSMSLIALYVFNSPSLLIAQLSLFHPHTGANSKQGHKKRGSLGSDFSQSIVEWLAQRWWDPQMMHYVSGYTQTIVLLFSLPFSHFFLHTLNPQPSTPNP